MNTNECRQRSRAPEERPHKAPDHNVPSESRFRISQTQLRGLAWKTNRNKARTNQDFPTYNLHECVRSLLVASVLFPESSSDRRSSWDGGRCRSHCLRVFWPSLCGRCPKRCPSVPGSELTCSPSHLIRREPSLASLSVLRASCSRTSDFRTRRPTPTLGWETAAADLHRGKPVLFQAWNLEPVVGVSPHHPLSRCPCQAEASPEGSHASALISRAFSLPGLAFSLPHERLLAPSLMKVMNFSSLWPLFASLPLKCVRRREALHHV